MRKPATILNAFAFPALCVAQQGSWEQVFSMGDATHQPSAAVHMIHVFDGSVGKVMLVHFFSGEGVVCPEPNPVLCASDLLRLWTPPAVGNPGAGTIERTPFCNTQIGCSGHSALADGRIFIAGGVYTRPTHLFDPHLPVMPPAAPIACPVTIPWSNQWA